MDKLIFLICICFVTTSCIKPSTTEDNSLITATDTVQGITLSKTATTETDVLVASPDKYKLVLENEHVRVIKYTLKPGEKDNPHTHPPKTAYVISGGTFRVYPENEDPFDFVEVQGVKEWNDRTSKHYVENIGNTIITILLTEIKSAK